LTAALTAGRHADMMTPAMVTTPPRVLDDEVIDLTTPELETPAGQHLPIFRTPTSSGSRPAKRRLVFTCSTCSGVEHLAHVRPRETCDAGTQTEPQSD
jgi:hypothetical protein